MIEEFEMVNELDAKYHTRIARLLRQAGFVKASGRLNIQAFADAADLSYTTAYNIVDSGFDRHNLDTIRKAAGALGVKAAELLAVN